MKDLTGKVAVVTGAASGIGRAMAEAFAAEGMKLVLADVEAKVLDRVAAELGSKTTVLAVRTDVSKAAEVEALAVKTEEAFGAVHVVCNNAGVASGGLSWETSLADWEWVLGVNLWGVIHGVRSFVPRLLAHGGEAHLVNTASMAGLVSVMGMAPYNVTKHGVVTLSETLYQELQMVAGGRVGVSVLCPGWVQTQIHDSHRNRPAGAPPAQPGQIGAQVFDTVKSLVTAGLAPAEVAAAVVQAIREQRFYILTHPHWMGAVKHRMDDILAARAPSAPPLMK
jgi:NAD(P)-dependent dehydrogenase (short-subunit alcohol dehydrogenase family)